MRERSVLFLVCALLVAACGRTVEEPADTTVGSTDGTTATTVAEAAGRELVDTTPAGTAEVDSVTWAVYREVNSLDPIYAFDYPENTVLSVLCETLVEQAPDGSIVPGIADLEYVDDTTMVFTLKEGVTFWNGDPVTPADVVFSLERQRNPELGGFYGAVFSRVDTIEATGDDQVTITLTQPDYWLEGELSGTPGWILQQSFTEAAGADFATPAGGIMCSGSYALGEWAVGESLTVVRNDSYWDSSITPLAGQIEFVGPDPAALVTGLLAGDIDGAYLFNGPQSQQILDSADLTVTPGSGRNIDAFIVSSFDGPLGDARVRRALSMAVDRQGYIDTIYLGAATIPKSTTGPGFWGYGRDAFAAVYDELPELGQGVDAALAEIEGIDLSGQTLVMGLPSDAPATAAAAAAMQTAAEALGLTVELKAVSIDQYINFFIDPAFREGVDGFFTVNYGDYADPAAFISTISLADGSQNYTGYTNDEITQLLEDARTTADPDERAAKVAEADRLVIEDMVWIPLALPDSTVITSADLTGAVASFSYMFAPWANQLGGVG